MMIIIIKFNYMFIIEISTFFESEMDFLDFVCVILW